MGVSTALVAESVFAKGCGADVIESARRILRAVLAMGPDELRSPGTAVVRLPQWFVANCAAERPPEVGEQWLAWWRGLEPEARARAAYEGPWTLEPGPLLLTMKVRSRLAETAVIRASQPRQPFLLDVSCNRRTGCHRSV